MDRLSALTQRLVPSDSFDPAGPGLAVKECWAVTSRHCQWRSRSEWNTARSTHVVYVAWWVRMFLFFFGSRVDCQLRCRLRYNPRAIFTIFSCSLFFPWPRVRAAPRPDAFASLSSRLHVSPSFPLCYASCSQEYVDWIRELYTWREREREMRFFQFLNFD